MSFTPIASLRPSTPNLGPLNFSMNFFGNATSISLIIPDAEMFPNRMSGDGAGHRECHIIPDWLLVYRIKDDVLVLTLARTGTHNDLFGK